MSSSSYTFMLFLHFFGVALGVGASLAMMTLGRASAALPPPERGAFMGRVSALSRNGAYGLLLLLVSGVAMTALRGVGETMRWGGGAFHAKLTLVLVMCGLFGLLQVTAARARRNPGGPESQRLPKLSMAMLALGVSVVALATVAFH